MEELRYILKYVRGLLTHTEETWTNLAEPETKEGQVEYMLRGYYWPLLGTGSLLIFILYGNGIFLNSKLPFDAPFNFEYAMKGLVSFATSYVVAPTLARLIIEQLYSLSVREKIEKDRLEIFVHYSMSIVMIIELFCACLPQFTFLTFIGVYLISIVYLGIVSYLKLTRHVGLLLLISSFSIYASPWIMQHLLALFAK